MLAKSLVNQSTLVKYAQSTFSYNYRETKKIDMEFNRKLSLLRMMSYQKSFNYEQPEMVYDKATGDIQIIDKMKGQKKKIIQNFDELAKERAALLEEVNKDKNVKTPQEKAQKLAVLNNKFKQEFDVDPSEFQAFSRDGMRVDLGLIIQRPPIFVHMTPRDIEHMKLRSQVMNEYFVNQKAHIDEFNEVTRLNEDLLAENSYVSQMNLDNFPTHKLGEETYCAASKNWSKVDPKASDVRSLHYAPEDRTFLIFKNQYTNEWEFPTAPMMFGQTFIRSKQNLFDRYTENKWKVKFFGSLPLIHTVREMTVAESEEKLNSGLIGVRTYFFGAHHYRGLPEFPANLQALTPHSDFAWIPKRQLNEYFTKEYYDVFIHALRTR